MEFQVRTLLGEILFFFNNVFTLLNYFVAHSTLVSKISFDDFYGTHHHFVKCFSEGVFDRCIYDTCNRIVSQCSANVFSKNRQENQLIF